MAPMQASAKFNINLPDLGIPRDKFLEAFGLSARTTLRFRRKNVDGTLLIRQSSCWPSPPACASDSIPQKNLANLMKYHLADRIFFGYGP